MKPTTPDRPRQNVPAQIVADLLGAVRNQFYPDSQCDSAAQKQWFQDQNFIKQRVILWPAAWLSKRGVTLKPERYKQILLDIFNEIKRHGATDAIKFWPGYLVKCVQEHFSHHEDEIYEEAKQLRVQLERAMASAAAAVDRYPDPVAGLAQVHQVLAAVRRKRKSPELGTQLNLFKS